MASTIGIDWPVNSVGVLPDVDHTQAGFLDPYGGEEALAHLGLVNTRVLLEHYRIKHGKSTFAIEYRFSSFQELKQAHVLFYKPFGPLEDVDGSGMPARIRKLGSIEQLLKEGQWNEARQQSAHLIDTCLAGLRYLETSASILSHTSRTYKIFSYDRFLIRSIVIVAYVGWAAYTSISLLPALDNPPVSATRQGLVDVFTLLTFFGSAMAFWVQDSPWTLYVYVAFPCYFWRVFYLRGLPVLLTTISQSSFSTRQLCVYALLVFVSLQSMVVRTSFRTEVIVHRLRFFLGCIHLPLYMERWFRHHWNPVAILCLAICNTLTELETCSMVDFELPRYRCLSSPPS